MLAGQLCLYWFFGFVFFFFQAEDGIRDGRVTGVQTCALPIYSDRREVVVLRGGQNPRGDGRTRVGEAIHVRSEERRVGKECRSRWSWDHQKKKDYATVEDVVTLEILLHTPGNY